MRGPPPVRSESWQALLHLASSVGGFDRATPPKGVWGDRAKLPLSLWVPKALLMRIRVILARCVLGTMSSCPGA